MDARIGTDPWRGPDPDEVEEVESRTFAGTKTQFSPVIDVGAGESDEATTQAKWEVRAQLACNAQHAEHLEYSMLHAAQEEIHSAHDNRTAKEHVLGHGHGHGELDADSPYKQVSVSPPRPRAMDIKQHSMGSSSQGPPSAPSAQSSKVVSNNEMRAATARNRGNAPYDHYQKFYHPDDVKDNKSEIDPDAPYFQREKPSYKNLNAGLNQQGVGMGDYRDVMEKSHQDFTDKKMDHGGDRGTNQTYWDYNRNNEQPDGRTYASNRQFTFGEKRDNWQEENSKKTMQQRVHDKEVALLQKFESNKLDQLTYLVNSWKSKLNLDSVERDGHKKFKDRWNAFVEPGLDMVARELPVVENSLNAGYKTGHLEKLTKVKVVGPEELDFLLYQYQLSAFKGGNNAANELFNLLRAPAPMDLVLDGKNLSPKEAEEFSNQASLPGHGTDWIEIDTLKAKLKTVDLKYAA